MMTRNQAIEPRKKGFEFSSLTSERASDGSSIPSQSMISRQRQRTCESKACTWRSCLCSFHKLSRSDRRFWLLELPSLSALWNACDQPSCNRRQYRAYMWIGLTRIGVPFAITASLEVLLVSAKISISPSLAVERIVKYTSPDFVLLWKCQSGQIQWTEAREEFEDIVRSGKTSMDDVNPGGRSLLEVG
jgi:hypothetical protein